MLRTTWTHDARTNFAPGNEMRSSTVFPSATAVLLVVPLLILGLWLLLSA